MLDPSVSENVRMLYRAALDTVKTYEQALKQVEPLPLHEELAEFHSDHEQQLHNLGAALRSLGDTSAESEERWSRFLSPGFDPIPEDVDVETALESLRHNEVQMQELLNKALKWELSNDLKTMLRHDVELGEKHLKYIDTALTLRNWENLPA